MKVPGDLAPGVGSPQANPLSGCGLCHVDVVDEFAGSEHRRSGIGCAGCHGPSQGHAADENNEIKPDRVFTGADVTALCVGCHERSRPADGSQDQKKVCTDCHGAHDPAVRRR